MSEPKLGDNPTCCDQAARLVHWSFSMPTDDRALREDDPGWCIATGEREADDYRVERVSFCPFCGVKLAPPQASALSGSGEPYPGVAGAAYESVLLGRAMLGVDLQKPFPPFVMTVSGPPATKASEKLRDFMASLPRSTVSSSDPYHPIVLEVGPPPVKLGFDIGGVLSKYPDILRPIVVALVAADGVEVHVLTDMPHEKAVDWVHRNGFPVIPDRIHSCDHAAHGEDCKALKVTELGLDVLVDDHPGYVATVGAPALRLLSMPDPSRPYYHDDWKTDGSEGSFGRRKPAAPAGAAPQEGLAERQRTEAIARIESWFTELMKNPALMMGTAESLEREAIAQIELWCLLTGQDAKVAPPAQSHYTRRLRVVYDSSSSPACQHEKGRPGSDDYDAAERIASFMLSVWRLYNPAWAKRTTADVVVATEALSLLPVGEATHEGELDQADAETVRKLRELFSMGGGQWSDARTIYRIHRMAGSPGEE